MLVFPGGLFQVECPPRVQLKCFSDQRWVHFKWLWTETDGCVVNSHAPCCIRCDHHANVQLMIHIHEPEQLFANNSTLRWSEKGRHGNGNPNSMIELSLFSMIIRISLLWHVVVVSLGTHGHHLVASTVTSTPKSSTYLIDRNECHHLR